MRHFAGTESTPWTTTSVPGCGKPDGFIFEGDEVAYAHGERRVRKPDGFLFKGEEIGYVDADDQIASRTVGSSKATSWARSKRVSAPRIKEVSADVPRQRRKWHSRGREFDPHRLHHRNQQLAPIRSALLFRAA